MRQSICLLFLGTIPNAVTACSKPEAAQPPPPAAPPSGTVDAMPADAVVAVSLDASISALHLPRRDIDATKVLYRTHDEVRAIIGQGTPNKNGRWRYELGGGDVVDVVYEHGKALGIEMPSTTSGWDSLDAGQHAAVRAWAHIGDGTIQVRGHYLITGERFGGPGLAIYDEAFWKHEYMRNVAKEANIDGAAVGKTEAEQRASDAKAQREEQAAAAKAQREQQAAEKRAKLDSAAREGFVEQFALMAATSGKQLGFNVELGSPDTTLRIVGPCNAKILRFMVDTAGEHIRNVGFSRLECASNDGIGITP